MVLHDLHNGYVFFDKMGILDFAYSTFWTTVRSSRPMKTYLLHLVKVTKNK
jgi:hypothetical protein